MPYPLDRADRLPRPTRYRAAVRAGSRRRHRGRHPRVRLPRGRARHPSRHARRPARGPVGRPRSTRPCASAPSAGESIYELDEELVRELEPDLIVTQALCHVCAVSHDEVRRCRGHAARAAARDLAGSEDLRRDARRRSHDRAGDGHEGRGARPHRAHGAAGRHHPPGRARRRRGRAWPRSSGSTRSSSPGTGRRSSSRWPVARTSLGLRRRAVRAVDVGAGRRVAAGRRRRHAVRLRRRARARRGRGARRRSCGRWARSASSRSTRRRTSRGPARASSTASSCWRTSCTPTACRARRPRRSRSSSSTPAPTVLYLHSSAGRYGADRQLALLATGLDPARYRPLVVLRDRRRAARGPAGRRRRGARAPARGPAARADVAGGLARVAGTLARRRRRPRRGWRAARGVAIVHTNTSVTLGGARRRAGRPLPHVWHVREIYAGFERWWPALPPAAADAPTRSRASSERPPRSSAAPPRAGAPRRAAARARRARARRGARRARPPGGSVRLRDPRPDLDVEGPGRPRPRARATRCSPTAGRSRSSPATPWPGEERRLRELRELARALGVDRSRALRRVPRDVEQRLRRSRRRRRALDPARSVAQRRARGRGRRAAASSPRPRRPAGDLRATARPASSSRPATPARSPPRSPRSRRPGPRERLAPRRRRRARALRPGAAARATQALYDEESIERRYESHGPSPTIACSSRSRSATSARRRAGRSSGPGSTTRSSATPDRPPDRCPARRRHGTAARARRPPGVLADSARLLQSPTSRAGARAHCTPRTARARRCSALEDRFDAGSGSKGGAGSTLDMLPGHQPLHAAYNLTGVPGWERPRVPVRPGAGEGLTSTRYLDIDDDTRRARRGLVRRGARRASPSCSSDGRRYLVGDRFSAADLAFAALCAPLIVPPEYGTPLPQPDVMPEAMAARVLAWRDHPAGRFALRLFADQRRAVVSV